MTDSVATSAEQTGNLRPWPGTLQLRLRIERSSDKMLLIHEPDGKVLGTYDSIAELKSANGLTSSVEELTLAPDEAELQSS